MCIRLPLTAMNVLILSYVSESLLDSSNLNDTIYRKIMMQKVLFVASYGYTFT